MFACNGSPTLYCNILIIITFHNDNNHYYTNLTFVCLSVRAGGHGKPFDNKREVFLCKMRHLTIIFYYTIIKINITVETTQGRPTRFSTSTYVIATENTCTCIDKTRM